VFGHHAASQARRVDRDVGAMDALEELALRAYDRVIGLELGDIAIDGCITKAPCGGEKAGESPVDRGKQGIKHSTAVDDNGIPLGVVSAPADRNDSPLLAPTPQVGCCPVMLLPSSGLAIPARASPSRARPPNRTFGRTPRRRAGPPVRARSAAPTQR
jgi:hypothetical protein